MAFKKEVHTTNTRSPTLPQKPTGFRSAAPPAPGCWDLDLQAGLSVYCQRRQVRTNKALKATPRLELRVTAGL